VPKINTKYLKLRIFNVYNYKIKEDTNNKDLSILSYTSLMGVCTKLATIATKCFGTSFLEAIYTSNVCICFFIIANSLCIWTTLSSTFDEVELDEA